MSAKKAIGSRETGKGYPFTRMAAPTQIKRHLKPIKGGCFNASGGGFSGFAGGVENA